jgi:hypothetical protein
MNTHKSDEMIRNLREKGPQYRRRMITHRQVFQTTPDKLFPLLCPTREYDWIDGWHCELIYSQSLRQEYNLIIRTDFFQLDEVWVISHFEPNRSIEFTRFSQDLSVKVDIAIRDNLDGTSTGDWTIYATALTARGNEVLAQLTPEADPLGLLIDALDHYITHDTVKPLPAERFNKRI